ncbi:MAG: hypothetical protein Q9197_001376 [Variospora fuerteventurae]
MCDANEVTAKLSMWKMLDANRCQAQVGTFFRLYTPFLNHYVSGMPCHASQNDHEQCSWDGCVGNNVREASYKTQHVQQICSCNSIGPDPRQLHQLVRNNAIPLIELNIVSGQPRIKLVPAQLGTKYVTLSHVWAGGLGNFKENRLPICQLLRLYDLLNRLDNFRPSSPGPLLFQFQQAAWFTLTTRTLLGTWALLNTAWLRVWDFIAQVVRGNNSIDEAKLCRPMYFWMDTLCVPVDPQESPLRRKAIGNMALIYAAGQRCLVLDPELQHISMQGLTLTQLNAHVLCSTWLTRSWTFQEAKLSREWYAQFEDGLYNPNCTENAALHHHLYADWVTRQDDAHSLASEMISWYHNMPAVRQLSITANQSARLLSDATHSFITVWNHLVSRSTSKMEDVHGIMANTLDLSAVEILALPVQERMKAILRTQESLPAALIYNSAPKINDTRCRWVPLYPYETYFSDRYGVLIPSTNGFLLDKSRGNPVGFLVDPSVPRFEKICLAESCGSSPLWITFLAEPNGPPISFEAPGDTLKVCYVVGHLEKSTKYQNLGRRFTGARFALRKVEGKTLHLVYEYSFLYSHQPRKYFELRETFETISAERTDADAEFYVESDLQSWPTLTYRRDTRSEKSMHGLHCYVSFWFVCLFALVWGPQYYISGVSNPSRQLLWPTTIFMIRVAVALFELKKLEKQVNEHAYTAWVKTFDESGSLKKSECPTADQQAFEINTRVKVGLFLGVGGWILAVSVEGWSYLRWFGVAMLLELAVRWAVDRIWWGTGVRRMVKGFLKKKGWW